jgi:fatty-acyl-CoA synthase
MGAGIARRQTLSDLPRRSALRHGDRTAIRCGDTVWSYSEFDAIIDRLATGLVERGVAPGDRVAILSRNNHAFMAVRFAVARAGAVLVPVNFMLTAPEIRYILEHAGAKLLFVDASTADVALEASAGLVEATYGLEDEQGGVPAALPVWSTLLSDGAPVDGGGDGRALAQIIYTSGTESRPKGAMLSHEAVLWQYQSCIIDCEWAVDTVAVHAMPLFHCAQLDAMIGPALAIGATNIITAAPTPEQVIPLIEAHRANSFFAPPTIWIALLRSPLFDRHDLSSLVRGYYGASIMPVEVLRELRDRLPALRLWNLYGQTEIAPVATILFPEEHAAKLGSAGRPTLHVETRVVDEAMVDVAAGEIGEIVHRSPQLLDGYWQDPDKTAEAFAGGWFHSGDLGVLDTDGYLTIVDRKKDMIKTGGENVASREVEEILYTHPAVSEVAVIGLPDPKWIEAVTAFIVLRDGAAAEADAILEHCRTRLAGFKLPKRILFVDAMPRNASGKILKRDLRQMSLELVNAS